VPYIKRGTLEELRRHVGPHQSLEIGIGVESGDDRIRNGVLGKLLNWTDLESAVRDIAELGLGFVAYLLIKPHSLLDDQEAIEDAVQSAKRVADLAKACNLANWRIAFEPVFITQGTGLEKHFQDGKYTLVNLWAVVEVLKRTAHLGTLFVGMSDEGLSRDRKPKGCPRCTETLQRAIEEFNGSNDVRELEKLTCVCPESRQWSPLHLK